MTSPLVDDCFSDNSPGSNVSDGVACYRDSGVRRSVLSNGGTIVRITPWYLNSASQMPPASVPSDYSSNGVLAAKSGRRNVGCCSYEITQGLVPGANLEFYITVTAEAPLAFLMCPAS